MSEVYPAIINMSYYGDYEWVYCVCEDDKGLYCATNVILTHVNGHPIPDRAFFDRRTMSFHIQREYRIGDFHLELTMI